MSLHSGTNCRPTLVIPGPQDSYHLYQQFVHQIPPSVLPAYADAGKAMQHTCSETTLTVSEEHFICLPLYSFIQSFIHSIFEK